MNRESEDLPERAKDECEDGTLSTLLSVDKKGLSRIDLHRSGIFFWGERKGGERQRHSFSLPAKYRLDTLPAVPSTGPTARRLDAIGRNTGPSVPGDDNAYQVLGNEPNREPRASRGRARRCNRGPTLHRVTGRQVGKTQQVGRSGSQNTCLISTCMPRLPADLGTTGGSRGETGNLQIDYVSVRGVVCLGRTIPITWRLQ